MGLSEATRRWEGSGGYVEVGGLDVFVYEKGSGPAVFFIHGFPTSCYDWRGIIDILSQAYRCVAYDLIGFGLSDKPEGWSYSLFQQADVAQGLVEALGITDAHVVCHDVGTSLHTELLVREQMGQLPFRVLSSTFLNGSILREMATLTPFQKLLGNNETLPQAIELCNNMGANYVEGLQGLMGKPECITAEDAEVMTELMMHKDGNRRIPASAGYMRERHIHRDRWVEAINAAEMPVQFIWATGDPVANIAMGRALHELVPQAGYTELEGLGHFLLMEDPPAVAALIGEFLKEQEGRA
jgi:pimeloyl-ACP methyl ester carboxylesterase